MFFESMSPTQKKEFIDIRNSHGCTPLYLACHFHHNNIVDYLLSADASYNLYDNYGWSPAFVSAKEGNIEALKLIVNSLTSTEHSRFIDKKLKGCGSTLLIIAVEYRQNNIVEYLVSIGANCEICHNLGSNSMHKAAQDGNLEVVKLLVAKLSTKEVHKFINNKTSSGSTPLLLACNKYHKSTAKYLLSVGADCKIIDPNGFNPAHIAAQRGDLKTLQLLVRSLPIEERYEFVSTPSKDHITPLCLASQNRHESVVKYLQSIEAIDQTYTSEPARKSKLKM